MKLPLLPVVAVLTLHATSIPARVDADQTPKSAAPKAAQPAALKTPEAPAPPKPWLTPEQLDKKKKDADNRRLFQTTEVLEFTLTADFKAIDRDRDPTSTKMYAATIVLPQTDGAKVSKVIRVRGR